MSAEKRADNKTTKKQVTISSTRELLEALKNPNAALRTATLRAIAEHPAEAFSMAERSGCDLIQELIQLCETTDCDSIRTSYVYTLLNLDDDRVVQFAKQEFMSTDNSDIIVLAASKLAKLPEPDRIALLAPVVMAVENQVKSRAAANLLAHCQHLATQLALRVEVLSDHHVEITSLNDDNLSDWLDALQGAYPIRTRKLLIAKKDGSFSNLLSCWNRLPAPIRLWAFKEAVKVDASEYKLLIQNILKKEEDSALLVAALESLRNFASGEVEEQLISVFYHHTDPAIRAAAISAGQTALDWHAMLENESSDSVRVAIITRIGQCKSLNELNLLADLLNDTSWRVRAAVTNAMVALAPASLMTLQRLLPHQNPVVRVAVVQALKRLGQDEWLEAQLSQV